MCRTKQLTILRTAVGDMVQTAIRHQGCGGVPNRKPHLSDAIVYNTAFSDGALSLSTLSIEIDH